MEKITLENRIKSACDQIYGKHKLLILNKTHERTIVGKIVFYLSPLFKNDCLEVSVEYNRVGSNQDVKKDSNGNPILPDIIIHEIGVVSGRNIVALQVKGYWNKEDRKKDEAKLRDLQKQFGYKFLYRLELLPEKYELIQV